MNKNLTRYLIITFTALIIATIGTINKETYNPSQTPPRTDVYPYTEYIIGWPLDFIRFLNPAPFAATSPLTINWVNFLINLLVFSAIGLVIYFVLQKVLDRKKRP